MTATIINGKAVSSEILSRVRAEVSRLKKGGLHPKLAFILVGDNPGSLAYVRQKKKACEQTGIGYKEIKMSAKSSTKKIIGEVERMNRSSAYHGIIVQLPLPAHVDSSAVTGAVSPKKDVDGFHAENIGRMFLSMDPKNMFPCTPSGVIKLLDHYKIPIQGQEVTIIGRSNIVGKPLAAMFINRGGTVTVCNSKTKNLKTHTKKADIVCAATGIVGILKGNMVKKGCVVIDVGFSRVNDKILGDVDFSSVSKKAAYITPVPGGVGPMTVACLMENIVKAAKMAK